MANYWRRFFNVDEIHDEQQGPEEDTVPATPADWTPMPDQSEIGADALHHEPWASADSDSFGPNGLGARLNAIPSGSSTASGGGTPTPTPDLRLYPGLLLLELSGAHGFGNIAGPHSSSACSPSGAGYPGT